MDEIEKTIKTIPVHVKRWNLFALIAPPIFLSAGTSLLLSDIIEFGSLFWVGVGLMAGVSFLWWIWILNTIFKLARYLWSTHAELTNAITELSELRRDINKSKKEPDGKDL